MQLLPQIHLWAPQAPIPVEPWVDLLQELTSKYRAQFSAEFPPIIAHLRDNCISEADFDDIVDLSDDSHLNILLLTRQDLDIGFEKLSTLIRETIDNISSSTASRLIVFDLVQLQIRSPQPIVALKNFLHMTEHDQDKVIIRQLTEHSCARKGTFRSCELCALKISITIVRELMKNHVAQIQSLLFPREP